MFIYDDVPGGAGYARAIQDNLEEIARLALHVGKNCPNQDCSGACYHCLLGYRNQQIHNLLDRRLAVSVLEYLLENRCPSLSRQDAFNMALGLEAYMRNWEITGPDECPEQFGAVFKTYNDSPIGIRPIHPLSTRPKLDVIDRIREATGILPKIYTSFDLLRRPFWVANHLFRSLR